MGFEIRKIGVIGAGQMGKGIAHVCALAGYDVALNDISQRAYRRRHRRCRRADAPRRERGQIDASAVEPALERISERAENGGLCRRRLLIEAATEVEDVKRKILTRARAIRKARRDHQLQYVIDFDHAPCRGHRSAGALHRHSLHELYRASACRTHSRHRDP